MPACLQDSVLCPPWLRHCPPRMPLIGEGPPSLTALPPPGSSTPIAPQPRTWAAPRLGLRLLGLLLLHGAAWTGGGRGWVSPSVPRSRLLPAGLCAHSSPPGRMEGVGGGGQAGRGAPRPNSWPPLGGGREGAGRSETPKVYSAGGVLGRGDRERQQLMRPVQALLCALPGRVGDTTALWGGLHPESCPARRDPPCPSPPRSGSEGAWGG